MINRNLMMSSAGNSTGKNNPVGIYGGGYGPGTASYYNTANRTTTTYLIPNAYTDKYTFATDAVAAGTALVTALAELAACSNSDIGIFGGGSSIGYTATTNKYTFATNACIAGTSLTTPKMAHAAASSPIIGIFTGGGYNGGLSPFNINGTTCIYTFATNIVSTGTSLTAPRANHAGCSGSTCAIFGAGYSAALIVLATTDKYTFATNAVAAGTSLAAARTLPIATANSTTGLFSAGTNPTGGTYSTYMDKYTFATNTVAAGTSLGGPLRGSYAATGNATVGVFSGGLTSGGGFISASYKYTYATNSVAAGTSLASSQARYLLAAC